MSQALAASKQINLNKLINADGVKNCSWPTLAKPIFELRAVYIESNSKIGVLAASKPRDLTIARAFASTEIQILSVFGIFHKRNSYGLM